jgi:hypothetical protein
MVELIATILVVGLFLYYAWPWLWHIATTLALALLVYYIALPWFWQSKSWEDFKASLQQFQLPQRASAAMTSSGRLYVSPQRTQESRDHFEALGEEEYPRPYPRPILLIVREEMMCSGGRGNVGFCSNLCVAQGRLQWCWPARPNASAVPCKSPDTGKDGWCWGNEVASRNDS